MALRTLGVVVSANGFGHIRRQLMIASGLLGQDSQLRVVFGITEAQYKRFFPEISKVGSRLIVLPGLTGNSPRWLHDPSYYNEMNLNGWETDLRASPDLYQADYLVSDNLVGVLTHRPDAWLSGSFLWSDVLEAHQAANVACERFIKRERSLLEKLRPPMIANRYLVTPGVAKRTQLVEVSWMIEEPKVIGNIKRDVVLIHGGGTRTLDDVVVKIHRILDEAGVQTVTDLENDPGRFDYEEESWSRIGLVICRPGVGTVTECVKWRIPILAIPDHTNNEAQHVIESLVSLGLATTIDEDLTQSGPALTHIVKSAFSFDVKRYDSMQRTGVKEAVTWILRAMNSARS